jgi:hypothetical protein
MKEKKNAPETFDWFPHLSRLSRVEAMRRWPGNRGDVGLGTEETRESSMRAEHATEIRN